MANATASDKTRIGWIGLGKWDCRYVSEFLPRAASKCVSSRAVPKDVNGPPARPACRAPQKFAVSLMAPRSSLPRSATMTRCSTSSLERGRQETLNSSQTFVDISTVSPDASRRVAGAMSAIGADYVRSPVSGSTTLAAQGGLTAIISGPVNAIERLDEFYRAFTRKTFVVGREEEARYLKLVLNGLVGGIAALLAEALAIGCKGGLGVAGMMDVICQSAVASPLLQYKLRMSANASDQPAFTVRQIMKDLTSSPKWPGTTIVRSRSSRRSANNTRQRTRTAVGISTSSCWPAKPHASLVCEGKRRRSANQTWRQVERPASYTIGSAATRCDPPDLPVNTTLHFHPGGELRQVDDRALVEARANHFGVVAAFDTEAQARPSMATSSISAVTRIPSGVAALWLMSTCVPTVPCCSPRYGAMASMQAASARAII